MKAILTKFHGPTNTKGSRYSASDGDGNKETVPADHALSSSENHIAAAKALCSKMDWSGTLAIGHTQNGYCFVFITETDQVTVLNNGGTNNE